MIIITIAKSNKLGKAAKAILISAVVIISLIIVANMPKDETTVADNQSAASDSQLKPSEASVSKEPEIDKNIKAIMDGTTLNQNESEMVFNDLKSVGYKSVSSIKEGIGTGVDELQSYVFNCDGITTTVTIEKRKTRYIGSGNIDLFHASKGGAIDQITNYAIPSDKESMAMILAEDFVKQGLKAPSTAEFPGRVFDRDQWKVARNKDLLQVQSYVDSENSFGAMIRSDFIVQMDYETESLIYMEIGGEVVYGTPYKEDKAKK
jgi:hypothetical protein